MWQTLNKYEVERKLRTSISKGLSKEEAESRKNKHGPNKLEEKKKENLFMRFLKQFQDFMIIILIIAAVVSAVISFVQGENDYVDSIIIISIVVLNAIMGLIQEAKAEKSLEALKDMSSPVAKVRRNGKIASIKSTEIVPGDIVLLEAGNFVPADCRLINSQNLKVEESSLTGETIPVEKNADVILDKETPIGDTLNMAFANTIVVNGHAEAIVTETGMNTKVGKIAKMIITNESPQTPLQRKLGEVGKTLGIAALSICGLIFVIGVLKKIEPIEMFMTSVGLAVAAIPEGLPAIVTIMLSIGVTRMARKNSIVRKLPAVETLGSSSVICSDKTGTLTQNKMQVTKVMDIGEESLPSQKELVLELGAMCTDVEENIGEATELAIVNAAERSGKLKNKLYEEFNRINDIPFDSNRKMMSTIHRFTKDKQYGNKIRDSNLENILCDLLDKQSINDIGNSNAKNNLNEGYLIITKGAPDILLKHCNKYLLNNQIHNLDNKDIMKIEKSNGFMAENALRVIAVAFKVSTNLPDKIESSNVENNLIFCRINRNDRSAKRRCKGGSGCM